MCRVVSAGVTRPVAPAARRAVTSALAALALSACGAGAPAREVRRAPAVDAPARVLAVVAHQDDDLLFLNPALLRVARGGGAVRTIYVTAGDAGRQRWNDGLLSLAPPGVMREHWELREQGIFAAYAAMAGAPDAWTTTRVALGAHTATLATLEGAPRVSVVFLRLPDGNVDGTGFEATGHTSIARVWRGEAPSVRAVDDAGGAFTRDELIAALGEAMRAFSPSEVWTLDATGCGHDHSDHVHASLFASEARRRYAPGAALRMFRGYGIADDPVNLDPPARDAKWGAFLRYAAFDMCKYPRPREAHGPADEATCESEGSYHAWGWRQYELPAAARDAALANFPACAR